MEGKSQTATGTPPERPARPPERAPDAAARLDRLERELGELRDLLAGLATQVAGIDALLRGARPERAATSAAAPELPADLRRSVLYLAETARDRFIALDCRLLDVERGIHATHHIARTTQARLDRYGNSLPFRIVRYLRRKLLRLGPPAGG